MGRPGSGVSVVRAVTTDTPWTWLSRDFYLIDNQPIITTVMVKKLKLERMADATSDMDPSG